MARGKQPSPPKVSTTKAQVRQRVTQVELMLSNGWRHSIIVAAMKEQFKVGQKTTEKYITRIYKKWRDLDDGVDKAEKRRRQVNRLHSMLEDKSITATERVRVETLIAKIEGTLAPIEVGGINNEPIKCVVVDYRSGEPQKGDSA